MSAECGICGYDHELDPEPYWPGWCSKQDKRKATYMGLLPNCGKCNRDVCECQKSATLDDVVNKLQEIVWLLEYILEDMRSRA